MGIKDVAKMKQQAEAFEKELEQIKATGQSKRGFVTVTLNGKKALKRIELSNDAMNLPKEEIQKYIMEAHKVADKEIDKKMKKQSKNSPLAGMMGDMMG